jgi:transcriptional regulator with XRE-family HTH domain
MNPKAKTSDKRNALATAIGKRVKMCRIEAGKSQEELAHDALVDRTYISSIERGVANPSIETLANLAYCMGRMTLAELFEPLNINLKPTGTRRANVGEPGPVRERRLR